MKRDPSLWVADPMYVCVFVPNCPARQVSQTHVVPLLSEWQTQMRDQSWRILPWHLDPLYGSMEGFLISYGANGPRLVDQMESVCQHCATAARQKQTGRWVLFLTALRQPLTADSDRAKATTNAIVFIAVSQWPYYTAECLRFSK